jgi:magnesium-transporting ATPase (P-type)
VYIVASFLNQFGNLQIVQKGVGFNFFFINCCQLGWIVSYCCDYIWIAFLFMVVNTCLLVWLNFNLYYQGHINKKPRFDNEHVALPQSRPTMAESEMGEPIAVIYEFLLFRLPFQLHLGWVICVLLLNLNEMAVVLKWNSLSNIAVVSIVILWIAGKKKVLLFHFRSKFTLRSTSFMTL